MYSIKHVVPGIGTSWNERERSTGVRYRQQGGLFANPLIFVPNIHLFLNRFLHQYLRSNVSLS